MERYALLWLFTAVVLLGLSLWRDLLEKIAAAVGIFYAPSALFAIAFALVTVVLLHFSVVISRLADQSKVLAQQVGILSARVRRWRIERSSWGARRHPAGSMRRRWIRTPSALTAQRRLRAAPVRDRAAQVTVCVDVPRRPKSSAGCPRSPERDAERAGQTDREQRKPVRHAYEDHTKPELAGDRTVHLAVAGGPRIRNEVAPGTGVVTSRSSTATRSRTPTSAMAGAAIDQRHHMPAPHELDRLAHEAAVADHESRPQGGVARRSSRSSIGASGGRTGTRRWIGGDARQEDHPFRPRRRAAASRRRSPSTLSRDPRPSHRPRTRQSMPASDPAGGSAERSNGTRRTPSCAGRRRVRTSATTRQPRSLKRRTRCEPMNPSAPVIATTGTSGPLERAEGGAMRVGHDRERQPLRGQEREPGAVRNVDGAGPVEAAARTQSAPLRAAAERDRPCVVDARALPRIDDADGVRPEAADRRDVLAPAPPLGATWPRRDPCRRAAGRRSGNAGRDELECLPGARRSG